MTSEQEQKKFIQLTASKFSEEEFKWLNSKMIIVSNSETQGKFSILFGFVSRFIKNEDIQFTKEEIITLETIYPGFGKAVWNKQVLARTFLMLSINTATNKDLITSFFESAEMNEQIALYKGLYLLQNATEFKNQLAEGIRTNMVNVFDAIASGNPFPQKYLDENEWNQLILKSFFMDRPLFKVQDVDLGKNSNLANMLQDYVKERWAANRSVSLEIWRMIKGYLRDDIKTLILSKKLEGLEKDVLYRLLENNTPGTPEYWNKIGENI